MFRFEELRGLRVFIDAVQFESTLVALYQSNQIVVYSLDEQNGFLVLLNTFNIAGEAIVDGQFVVSQEHILLFTTKKVIKISRDGPS